MPFPFIPVAAAALFKGVTSYLGQRSANKQSESVRAERERVERDKYARQKANYDAAVKRRKATLAFAKSVAAARGYGIPESSFALLENMESPEFPQFSAPIGAHRPSSLGSGIAGGLGGAADVLTGTERSRALEGQFRGVGLDDPTKPKGKKRSEEEYPYE